MGLYWFFFFQSHPREDDIGKIDCTCSHCGHNGELGYYKGWSFVDDADDPSPVDFMKESEKFFIRCQTNAPCAADYYALFMLCFHDDLYGGLT